MAVFAGLLLFQPTPRMAYAQQSTPVDYAAMRLEDLMNIDVTSVSKKEQKLTQTAAAVFVITQEDIRRSGATSIPELLRMVPGLEVARISGTKWAVTARGFNGRYSNNLLVLVDNRPIYDPSFGGVLWEFQEVVLEDVERIEVIRGPGAAMWGANAVNGVIHIITRQAGSDEGGLLSMTGGNEERAVETGQWDGNIGKGLGYRLYFRHADRDQGLATLPQGGFGGMPWDQFHGGGRADWRASNRDTLTLEADVSITNLDEAIHFGSPQLGFSPMQRIETNYDASDISLEWRRKPSETSEMRLQFFYDEHYYDQAIAIKEGLQIADLDFQYRKTLSARHELMWGAGFRESMNHQHNFGNYAFLPPDRADPLFSGFFQDQISIRPDRLVFTLGTKVEHNNYTGFEVQPDARLSWAPDPHHELWTSVARAVSTPSRVYSDMLVETSSGTLPGGTPIVNRLMGNRQIGSESLIAYEAGYRIHGKRFALDVAGFRNTYQAVRTPQLMPGFPDMSTLPPTLVVPMVYMPAEHGFTYGAEVSAQWQASERLRISASTTILRMNLTEDLTGISVTPRPLDGSSPAQQFQVRSNLNLTHKLELDSAVYEVGRIASLQVPAYVRVDARLGWKPANHLELSLASENLLNHPHVEFVAEDPTMPTMKIGRTAYAKLTWRF